MAAHTVYEHIFYDGEHEGVDWDEVNSGIDWDEVKDSTDWKRVSRPNLERLAAGENYVWFPPPWTHYTRSLHKFNLKFMHNSHGRTHFVYGHTTQPCLVIVRVCPEIILALKSVTSVGANVEITFDYAMSGEPFITLTLDRARRYSLVTIEREIRVYKENMQNTLTFLYNDQILRKNTVMWHPGWETVLEPLRRLRRRTSIRGQLQLDQFFG